MQAFFRRSNAWEARRICAALCAGRSPGPNCRYSQQPVRRGRPDIHIGKDLDNERPQRSGSSIEHKRSAIAILNIGRVDCDAQQQAERINEDVPLAPRDLLARIVTLRVKRGPPFCAALALWLSMMAAVGLASRPSCSRTATYST